MKIAVTGGSGFVGRHVLAEFASRGIDIVATTRHKSPRSTPSATVRWVTLDLAQPPASSMAALGHPDVLLHLAWNGLPHYRSLHHFETELPLQYRFLAGLVREGLGGLITTGTCLEYGMQSGPLAHTAQTLPTTPYGFGKDALRKQLQLLKEAHPFAFTWARLFYMHGAGQAGTSLLPMLESTVAQGKDTFDMSGGEQLRDYLPVAEVARRLVDLAIGRRDLGPINLCSGKPISVRSLVEGWIRERGWNIELRLGQFPYPDYEPMAFWGIGR